MKSLHLNTVLLFVIAMTSAHIAAQSSGKAVEQLEKDLGVELSFSATVTFAQQQFTTGGTVLFNGTGIAVHTPTHSLWYNGSEAYTLQKNEMYNELYIALPQGADTLLFRPLEILAISKTECTEDNRLKRIYGEYSEYTFNVEIDRYIRTGVKFDSSEFVPETDSIPDLEIIDLR